MKIREWKWRYLILVCDCLLTFGCYFSVGLASALQAYLQGNENTNCTQFNSSVLTNVTCCEECLGLGPQKYNLLFTVLSWTSAAISIPAGYVMDKVGNRVSAIVIPLIYTTGTTLFALANSSLIVNTPVMFPLMLIGRVSLGFGTGPGRVLQNRVVSFWFREKSVIPISFIVLTIRSANVLNFFLTANLAEWFGLSWALWTGMFLSCIGLLSGVSVAILDRVGTNRLDEDEKKQMESKPVRLKDIKKFPPAYWFLVIMMATTYSSVIPYLWNATKFYQDQYDYSKTESSYINGAVYDVSLLSPILGKILEKIDCHGIVGMFASLFTVPVYILLGYLKDVPPLAMSVCIGLTFNCNEIILWQALTAMVPPTSYGTAAGIVTSCMGVFMGLTSLLVGTLLRQEKGTGIPISLQKYQHMLLLFASLSAVAVISALFMNVLDIRSTCNINRRLKKRKTSIINVTVSETDPLIHNKSDNE